MTSLPPRRSTLVLVLGVRWPACTQTGPRFDLIVRGGDVIDGSGQAARRADVGIAGDRITAIGDLASAAAGRVIDASGLVVAPGFIDVQGQSGTTLLADGNAESHIRQGITSEIIGEGGSPAFWTAADADAESLAPFGITVRLDRLLRLFRSTAAGRDHRQCWHVRAGHDGASQHHRHGQPAANRRRARAHGGDGRSGDARWRVRPVERVDLRAGIVCQDGRTGGAREGGGQAQRHLHHPHSRRELQPVQRAR